MAQTNRILLLDDGELTPVVRILEDLGLKHTRLRGEQVIGKLSPPEELLITSSRCASLVKRGSPPDAPKGRPLRIIAASDHSSCMRRKLRRLGFDLLVGLDEVDDIWRPLISSATFSGEERRRIRRTVIGAPITVSSDGGDGTQNRATLMDVSSRSCRLQSSEEFAIGSRYCLALNQGPGLDHPIVVWGRVSRSYPERADELYGATLDFDDNMRSDVWAEFHAALQDWSWGPPPSLN